MHERTRTSVAARGLAPGRAGLALALAAAVGAVGCGQKGPLRLPEPLPAPVGSATGAASAPAR